MYKPEGINGFIKIDWMSNDYTLNNTDPWRISDRLEVEYGAEKKYVTKNVLQLPTC